MHMNEKGNVMEANVAASLLFMASCQWVTAHIPTTTHGLVKGSKLMVAQSVRMEGLKL